MWYINDVADSMSSHDLILRWSELHWRVCISVGTPTWLQFTLAGEIMLHCNVTTREKVKGPSHREKKW